VSFWVISFSAERIVAMSIFMFMFMVLTVMDLRVWRNVWKVWGWEDPEKRRVWSVVADVMARSVAVVRSMDHEILYSGCSSGVVVSVLVSVVFVLDDDLDCGCDISSCS